jgi:hypothetical protein
VCVCPPFKWATLGLHPRCVTCPERPFDEPRPGSYVSGLRAMTNPWDVVSSSRSGALRAVA